MKIRSLWYKIRRTPEMYNYLTDAERYKTDKAHSYIRLVYECRARLVKAQKRTMDTYLNCRQRSQEKTTEYIDRLRGYRLKASGPYQEQWPCDTWEEHLQKVTTGLMDGQIAAAVERERPKNTENLWGIINREKTKRNRPERSQGFHVAWTGRKISQTRLEDMYGNRTQIQQHIWRDSARTRCYRCNQEGHRIIHCTWIAGADAPRRERAVFQEGSL